MSSKQHKLICSKTVWTSIGKIWASTADWLCSSSSPSTSKSRTQSMVTHSVTHSLTAALDQLRVVASSTSNDPGPRSKQHQQIGQCLLPIAAANFSVDDPAGASSQQREECRCGLLLTVAVPAKQVCSAVGDRCDQIMNDVCQQ